jgi:hypothetical protein
MHKIVKIVNMRVTSVRVELLLKLNYSTYKTDASCSLSFCVKMILSRNCAQTYSSLSFAAWPTAIVTSA